MNPFRFLQTWWKTHSKVSKLGISVLGVSATIAVVASLAKGNLNIAGLYIVAGMAAVVVMSIVERAITGGGRPPGKRDVRAILYDAVVVTIGIVFLAVIVLLFTSFFFCWPLKLGPQCVSTQSIKDQGISIGTLEQWLKRSSTDQHAARLARAIARDARLLATNHLPITGEKETTGRLTVPWINLIFLQDLTSVVKVQTFPLPPSAKNVRGQSNRRYDEEDDFNAQAWAFILNGNSITSCKYRGEGDAGLWEIPALKQGESSAQRIFGLIALYPNIHILEGRVDGVTIEIDDLAGVVQSLNVAVCGSFKSFRFDSVFEFPPNVSLRFIEVPETRKTSEPSWWQANKALTEKLLGSFSQQYNDSESTKYPHDKVIDVWKYCQTNSFAEYLSVEEVRFDVAILVSGECLGGLTPSGNSNVVK